MNKPFQYASENKENTLYLMQDKLKENAAPATGSIDFATKSEIRQELARQFNYAVKHGEYGFDPVTGQMNFTLRHMGQQRFFDEVEGTPVFETMRDFFEEDNWDSVGFRHANGNVMVTLQADLLIQTHSTGVQA